jgi:hypothetical protein
MEQSSILLTNAGPPNRSSLELTAEVKSQGHYGDMISSAEEADHYQLLLAGFKPIWRQYYYCRTRNQWEQFGTEVQVMEHFINIRTNTIEENVRTFISHPKIFNHDTIRKRSFQLQNLPNKW